MRRLLVIIAVFSSMVLSAVEHAPSTFNVVLGEQPSVFDIGFITQDLTSFADDTEDIKFSGDVVLVFNPTANNADGPASSFPCYLYWKIYSQEPMYITLSASDLSASGVEDPISYDLFLDSSEPFLSSGNTGKTLVAYDSDDFGTVRWDAYKLNIVTENLIDKATADYSGTITVVISDAPEGEGTV